MDLFHNLAIGFATAAQPANLLYAFLGCLLGTLIGVLPGLGPLATIAMLLPITYALQPDAALIMLAAGSITARSMAARPRRSWSICLGSLRRS
ncbi:TctA family transporter [Bradyrhizobium diazoefficiens]